MRVAAAGPFVELIQREPSIAVIGLVFFIALFIVILRLTARITGWAELAEHYRTRGPFQGQIWRFQSARMRYLTHYNGCLTFGANEIGMYAAGWGPFRLGAEPLLVPWSELNVSEKTRFLFPGYELRFRQSPEVYMWVWQKLGERLRDASAQAASGIRRAPPIG